MALNKELGVTFVEGLDAGEISNLLARKYSDSVFISECKNGETWSSHSLRLDAWVLLKTWSPLTTIGFEIKVSRMDFERDQKWIEYLPLCHQFYFVCPAGLIRPMDLPQGVGLMWVSASKNVRVKVPAQQHEPDVKLQNRLIIYALMARSVIVDDMYKANSKSIIEPTHLELVSNRLKTAEEKKELATFVKGHIRKMYDEIRQKEATMLSREGTMERFISHLKMLGITWNPELNYWSDSMEVENQIALLKQTIDGNLLWNMKNTGKLLTETANEIERMQKKVS